VSPFGTHHLGLFVLSGILLNITPGQDTLYILGRTISQGKRAGLLSVVGIVCGSIVHTSAAAFGLSAILATSAQAFVIVKMAGAIYLGYLGAQMLVAASHGGGAVRAFAPESDWAVFRAGLLTNVLNPKVALFFMAFLPQFVSPGAESRMLALLFLGGVFISNGTLWCLVLVWSAAEMSRRLQRGPASAQWVKRATGALFIGLGIRLAVSR